MKLTLTERRPEIEAAAGFESENTPLTRLRSLAEVHRLRRRQRLGRASPDTVYLVRSGLVAIEGAANPQSRAILELLYPGDIATPSLQPFVSDMGLTTATAAEVWRISTEAFSIEMQRNGSLADRIFRQLNAQRTRMHLHVAVLAGLASEQRVTALLIEAASRLGTRDGKRVTFDLPLSRTEVAEYLAINADTLSRIMSRLTQTKILQRSGRSQMTILDWDALLALCPIASIVVALHAPA